MSLIRTSLLNAVAVGVKMITMLGLNKVMAVYVGPAGYASLGQFQNAVQMISTVASGAINTGVTKYTAEYHEDASLQYAVWRTAGTVALFSSVIISLLVFSFRSDLARMFLNDERLAPVFAWFAATLILFVFNTLLLAILNGKKDVRRYVLANIAGSILGLLVTSAMVIKWGLMGALIGFTIYQSLAFFVTLALCVKTPWFQLSDLVGRVDKNVVKNLLKYTAMALTTAITLPLCQIMIRNYLGQNLGWKAAGYWEAMWRFSGAYLMLVSTTLSVYYLPRLAELKTAKEIRKEILSGYKVILPMVIVCALVIYEFRQLIIETMFSSSFMPMDTLFFWQLIGDVLKIASWLLGFVLTAKAMFGLYVFSEVAFSILFYVIIVELVSYIGLEGTAVAHTIVYLIHFIFMLVVLRRLRLI